MIPFDYDRILMPYIVVQVSIDGQPPLPFVVDTGASGYYLVVEPWAAKKLGLPSLALSKSQFVKGQGQKTVICTLIKTVKIVGVGKDNDLDANFNNDFFTTKGGSQKDTPFQIVSILSPLGDVYRGPQPAGIIPLDLLRLPKMVWQIDFQRNLLIFIQNEKGWNPTSGSFVLPLHRNSFSGLYDLSAAPAMGSTLDFALDTGSPITRVHDMAALPLPNAQSAKDMWVYEDRQRTYDTVLLPQLHLGDLVEPDVTLQETPDVTMTGSANMLGLDFLSRFLVTFDLAKNKMYLERRSDYAQWIVPPGQSGVRLEKCAGQYVAAWVEPGSLVDTAGLRTGDQIKWVDGQPLGSLPLLAAQDLLNGFEGTTAKLEVRTVAGKEVALSFTRSKKFLGRRHALLAVSLDWVQGNLMVSGVMAGSPLEHALKWGDEFYFINDQPVAKMTMDEAFRQLERADLALRVWRSSDKTWQELHPAPLPTQTQVLVGPLPAVKRYSFDSRTGWTAAPL